MGPVLTPGGYKVQLAAVRDQGMAEKEWKRLNRRHKDLLGGLGHSVTRIDLKTKGTFYRLRTTGVGTKEKAKALCELLKTRKVGCLIVRPR